MASRYNEVEHLDRTYQAMIAQRKKADQDLIDQAIEDYEKLMDKKGKTESDINRELAAERKKLNKEAELKLTEDLKKIHQEAIDAEAKYKQAVLKVVSAEERAEIHRTSGLNKLEDIKRYQENKKRLTELTKEFTGGPIPEVIQEEIKALEQAQEEFERSGKTLEESANEARDKILESAKLTINNKDASTEDKNATKEALKMLLKNDKTDVEAKKRLSELTQKDIKDAQEARKEEKEEAARERREQLKFRIEQTKSLLGLTEGLSGSLNALQDLADEGFDAAMKAIEEPISTYFEYQAKYEARLQGSENAYNKMVSNINKQMGLSPFVKQSKMVENIQRLIDSGVNYNIELRAYLATVTESIASTFNAFDSNLLRLIRIQQSDSTAARLGIEAALTQFLNSNYSDTSYLSDVADSVTQALLDASAQLTHQGAAEMEFVAQKWLGSLYSLGVSNDAVQTIATGLGLLGSGNIDQLSGNDTLMALLAMSATRGGTSISEILTGGLTADRTEELMRGMVTYLAEIASNTDSNNVTKSAMAQIFGLTNTDLRSINNLTAQDIINIADTTLTYNQALTEANSQIRQIASRTHLSQMIDNVVENATTGFALTIGGNPALYAMAKALNLVSGLVGDRGLEIPGIQVLGSGTASGIDILSVAKAGIMGAGLLGTLIGSINSLSNGGLPSLSSWEGYEKSLERGTGYNPTKGTQSGYSQSAQYTSRGNADSSDMAADSMQSAKDSAVENMSEEDQESANKAEIFYEQGLIHLENMADTITSLKTSSDAESMRVYVNNDNTTPVPVILSTGDKPIETTLIGIETAVQAVIANLLRRALLGEDISETSPGFGTDSDNTILTKLREVLEGLPVTFDSDLFGIDSALKGMI